MSVSVAYELGYKAYMDGNSYTQNPFQWNSKDSDDWCQGFSDAMWDNIGVPEYE